MSEPAVEVEAAEETPLLFSVKDAAKVLGLSPWQVRNLIVEERLPHVPVGARVYVPATALKEFVQVGQAS